MKNTVSQITKAISDFVINNSNSGRRFEARFGFKATDKDALRDWTR